MGSRALKIVAIDDNKDNLTVLQAVITDALPECFLYTADTGLKGIDLIREQDPDVVLLDIVMPKMNGFEVCQAIKADSRIEHIPVLFITALKTDTKSRIEALEAGGEGFISKPFEEAELIAQVRAMARIKRANDYKRDEKERLSELVTERTLQLNKELAERKAAEEQLKGANQTLEEQKARLTRLVSDLQVETDTRVKSETSYKTLVELAQEGIWATDAVGITTYVNPRLTEMLGYSLKEMTGRGFSSFFHGEYRDQAEKFIDRCRAGNRERSDFELVRSDEKQICVTIHATPIYDSDGECTGALAVVSDISLRKKQEEKLQETNAFLENLISNANVPIIVWDRDIRITRVNHAFEQLVGRPDSDLVGKPFSSLFVPDDAERILRLIQTTLDGVRWDTVEVPIVHMDGSIRSVLWNSSTIYGPDGRQVATIAQGRDITAECLLENEKKQALQQIQENIAKLAILNDGVRNPLSIIAAYADIIEDEQITRAIMEEIQRIDDMITNLDQEWIFSVKILDYLKKNYQISFDLSPPGSLISKPGSAEDSSGKDTPLLQKICNVQYIEETKSMLYSILDSIDAIVYVADMETYELLYLNRLGRSLFGGVIGQKCYEHLHCAEPYPCPFCTNHLLVKDGKPTGVHRWEHKNPVTGRWYDCRDRAIVWTDGRLVRLEIATDITERKHSEERTGLQLQRLQSFLKLHTQVHEPEPVILSSTLEHSLIITQSEFSFIGTLSSDENELIIHAWSQGAMDACSVSDKPLHFSIESAGVWGECIRKRRPFLLNDYTVHHPAKHGYPEGHVPIIRYLGVPIFDGTRIAAVLAVANKETDYLDEDVDILVMLGNQMWEILQRKRAERYLRESEDRFRSLAEDLPGYICSFLPGGILTYINPALAELTGKRQEELIGMSFLDLLEPDEAERIQSILKGVTPDNPRESHEQTVVTPDGKREYIEWNNLAFFDETGIITRYLAAGIDITDRKKTEQALAESEDKYRSVIENASEGIVVVQDGLIQYANPKILEMAEISLEEVINQPFTLFIHPDDRDMVANRYRRRVAGEDVPSLYDFRITGKRGAVIWVNISSVLISWRKGLATLNFLSDVTERKKVEDALRQANQQLGLLTSITRHDINNNLSIIFASLGLAQGRCSDPSMHEYFEDIATATRGIMHQIDFTRDFEQLGGQKPHWIRLDSVFPCYDLPDSVALFLHLPDIELFADPMLSRVFYNLFDNAVRHGEKVTEIRIKAVSAGEELKIIFEDNGKGILESKKEEIFGRGYGKNTGLGLFLAREILQLTGMTIRECGVEKKGARFEMTVPSSSYRFIDAERADDSEAEARKDC